MKGKKIGKGHANVSDHSCPSTECLTLYLPHRIIDILQVTNFDHPYSLVKKLVYIF